MENEELYHHGVLGMHWGKRKASKESAAKKKRSLELKNDTKEYRRLSKEINKAHFSSTEKSFNDPGYYRRPGQAKLLRNEAKQISNRDKFVKKMQKEKGQDYVNKVFFKDTMQTMAIDTATYASAAAIAVGSAYIVSKLSR